MNSVKGTIIFYDTFDPLSAALMNKVWEYAVQHRFKQLVLYPLHEQTTKRMLSQQIAPYHVREEQLFAWVKELRTAELSVKLERLEGKRKKYTPVDQALRHFNEYYSSPLFVLMQPVMANLFASYSTFEDWIKRIRLVLTEEPAQLHPRLIQYRHRWTTVDE